MSLNVDDCGKLKTSNRSSGNPFFTCRFVGSQATGGNVENCRREGFESILKESIRATCADHGNCMYPPLEPPFKAWNGAVFPSLSWCCPFKACSARVGSQGAN